MVDNDGGVSERASGRWGWSCLTCSAAVAVADEDGIVRFDHDQILHAAERDSALAREDDIAAANRAARRCRARCCRVSSSGRCAGSAVQLPTSSQSKRASATTTRAAFSMMA